MVNSKRNTFLKLTISLCCLYIFPYPKIFSQGEKKKTREKKLKSHFQIKIGLATKCVKIPLQNRQITVENTRPILEEQLKPICNRRTIIQIKGQLGDFNKKARRHIFLIWNFSPILWDLWCVATSTWSNLHLISYFW